MERGKKQKCSGPDRSTLCSDKVNAGNTLQGPNIFQPKPFSTAKVSPELGEDSMNLIHLASELRSVFKLLWQGLLTRQNVCVCEAASAIDGKGKHSVMNCLICVIWTRPPASVAIKRWSLKLPLKVTLSIWEHRRPLTDHCSSNQF